MPKVQVKGRPDWLVTLVWLTALPASLYCAYVHEAGLGGAILTAAGVICGTASARDLRELGRKEGVKALPKPKKPLKDET